MSWGALAGASLEFTPTYQYPQYVAAATGSIADILNPVVADLRSNHGAQVVVLLFHGGLASTGANGDLNPLVPLLGGGDDHVVDLRFDLVPDTAGHVDVVPHELLQRRAVEC